MHEYMKELKEVILPSFEVNIDLMIEGGKQNDKLLFITIEGHHSIARESTQEMGVQFNM